MEKDRLVTIFKNDKILINTLKSRFLIKDTRDYSEYAYDIINTENEIMFYALAEVLLSEEDHLNNTTIEDLVNENFLEEEIKLAFNSYYGTYETLTDLGAADDNLGFDFNKPYYITAEGNWYKYNGTSWSIFYPTTKNVDSEALARIYFSFKYSNVKNFFFDNYVRFLPEFDILKIQGKEKVKLFQESLMREFDKFATIIDDISLLQDVDEIPVEYIGYLGQLVGFEREEILYVTDERFRVFIKNIIEIYKVKGTNYSFELFLNFLGYNVEIFEYWFDRRYANYIPGFNPFTGETNKESYTFYLTPHNPTEVIPPNIYPKEFAKIEDISSQMNVWDFNVLAQQYEPNILLGYKKNYTEKKYTGNYFKFFKTNVVEFRLSVLSYSSVVTGEQELIALRRYIDFLLPINLIKIITITSVTPDEDAKDGINFWDQSGILGGTKEIRFDKFYSSDEIGNLRALYLGPPTFSDLDNIGLIGKVLNVKQINNQGQYPEVGIDKLFLYGKKQELELTAKILDIDTPTFIGGETGVEGYFTITREQTETVLEKAVLTITSNAVSSGYITVAKTSVAVSAGDTIEDIIEKINIEINSAIPTPPNVVVSEWTSSILTSQGGTILVCDIEIEITRGIDLNNIAIAIVSDINTFSLNWEATNNGIVNGAYEITFERRPISGTDTRPRQNEIIFQYSPNGIDWTSEFIPGNCYMRFSVNTGVTWETKNEFAVNTTSNILENTIFFTSFTKGVFKTPEDLFEASTKPDFNWEGVYLVFELAKWYKYNISGGVWEEYLPIDEETITAGVYDTFTDLENASTTEVNFNWSGRYYVTADNCWYRYTGSNWIECSPLIRGNLEEKLFNAYYIFPRDPENELDNLSSIYHLSKKNGRLHKQSSSRKVKNESSLQEHQIEKLIYRNGSNNSEVWIQKPLSTFNPIRSSRGNDKVEIRHSIDLLNDGIYSIISTRTETVSSVDYFVTEIDPIPYNSISTSILLQYKTNISITDPTFVDTDSTGLNAYIHVVQEGSAVPPYEKEIAEFVIYSTATNSGNIELAGETIAILNTDTVEEIIEKIKVQLITNNSNWLLKQRAPGTLSFITDIGYPVYSITKYVAYGTNTYSEIKIRNPYSFFSPSFTPFSLTQRGGTTSYVTLRYFEDKNICNDSVKDNVLILKAKTVGDKVTPTIDFGTTGISYTITTISEGTETTNEIINIYFTKKATANGTITIDTIEIPIFYTDSILQTINKIVSAFEEEEVTPSDWEAIRKEKMEYEIKSYRIDGEYLYIATEPILNLQSDIAHIGSTVRGLAFIDRDEWNLYKQYRTLFNNEDFFWYYT
jgi:hypothetical protein